MLAQNGRNANWNSLQRNAIEPQILQLNWRLLRLAWFANRICFYKIWGFHAGDYEECRLLGRGDPSQKTTFFAVAFVLLLWSITLQDVLNVLLNSRSANSVLSYWFLLLPMAVEFSSGSGLFQDIIILFRFSALKQIWLEEVSLKPDPTTCWRTTDFLSGFAPIAKLSRFRSSDNPLRPYPHLVQSRFRSSDKPLRPYSHLIQFTLSPVDTASSSSWR
jgi:hypothetical protein